MARPKMNTSLREHFVGVRYRLEEREILQSRAAIAGFSTVSEYIRHISLRGRITIRRDTLSSVRLISELRRIGNNLNQLTHIAHVRGDAPAGQLAETCASLDKIFDRILDQSPEA